MGMLDNIKDVMKMRSEAKRIQSMLAQKKVTNTNGGITAVVNGEGLIESISVEPSAYDEVKAGKPERFETMLKNVILAAQKKAKDEMQQEMVRQFQANGGGLGGLFGK